MNPNGWQRLVLVWRQVKRLGEFLAYAAFDGMALTGLRARSNEKQVVLVHLELLGDYVLWAPYARAMAVHLASEGWQVTLLVNAAVEPLVHAHVPNAKCIGLDRRAFVVDFRYRLTMLRQLRSLGASWVVHDSYPRDGLIEDASVRALAAPECWAFASVFADRPWPDRAFFRRLYSKLLPPLPALHQTERHHKMAIEMGVCSEEIRPISHFAGNGVSPVSGDYFVVAPGASDPRRRWPAAEFARLVSDVLRQRPGWRCIVVGTNAEQELCASIAKPNAAAAENWAGRTGMQSLLTLIANARLVIGNDSAAGHIAAACGVPSLVVVGGGHFDRCYPYADDSPVKRIPIVVAHRMPCFHCDWLCRWPSPSSLPFRCIANVRRMDAVKELQKVLDCTPHS